MKNMSATSSLDSFRSFARQLAGDAGRLAAERLGRSRVAIKDDDSPVTDADHAVQAAIFDAIARTYPDHAVVGEETIRDPEQHASAELAQYCWVVDPIDGTRNFAQGISIYATSIALMSRGEPVVGAIFDALSGHVYTAAHGHGIDCDGTPLKPPSATRMTEAAVLVSSFRRQPVPTAVRNWMDEYLFRNYGSICLHLAWVAAGLADGLYAAECRLWDIAAGALLVSEAGGKVTGNDGRPLWPIDVGAYAGEEIPVLAGTPAMHARLLESLRAIRSDD